MNTLIELSQAITSLQKEIADENKHYSEVMTELQGKLEKVLRERELFSAGIDLEKLRLAETVFSFLGDPTISRHGDYPDQHRGDTRTKLIEDAIRLIAASPDALSQNYLGVKNYASFGDQREDHKYFMGPRHGDIVFSVKRKTPKTSLTDAEREAGIYYLLNWKTIYQNKKAA